MRVAIDSSFRIEHVRAHQPRVVRSFFDLHDQRIGRRTVFAFSFPVDGVESQSECIWNMLFEEWLSGVVTQSVDESERVALDRKRQRQNRRGDLERKLQHRGVCTNLLEKRENGKIFGNCFWLAFFSQCVAHVESCTIPRSDKKDAKNSLTRRKSYVVNDFPDKIEYSLGS